MEQRKWNKPQILPLKSDLQKVRHHLKSASNEAIMSLSKDNANLDSWRQLATSTLVGLILFNRRRGGEPSKLTVEDFKNRRAGQINDEVKASLSVSIRS